MNIFGHLVDGTFGRPFCRQNHFGDKKVAQMSLRLNGQKWPKTDNGRKRTWGRDVSSPAIWAKKNFSPWWAEIFVAQMAGDETSLPQVLFRPLSVPGISSAWISKDWRLIFYFRLEIGGCAERVGGSGSKERDRKSELVLRSTYQMFWMGSKRLCSKFL